MINSKWVKNILVTLSLTLIFCASSASSAAIVKAVKDNKILIDLQGDAFQVGDVLRIKDTSGKAVGLVKIEAVKGQMAKGVFKGQAEKGFALSLKSSGSKTAKAKKDAEPFSNKKYGWLAGYSNSSASAKVTNVSTTSTASLSGSNFSLKALVDMNFLSSVNLRAAGGLQQYSVTGSDPNGGCGGSCDVKVIYLAGDLLARYMFTENFWAGAGAALMFPVTKSSSAITSSSISSTLIYELATGFDLPLGSGAYVPLQLEYDLFPTSNTVSASMLTLRAGYARSF